ncbi:MAG: response regulator [Candidatus Jacksonbacteria bacterium]|nr:response regulator [Candidatus Jacksonbacteria bacterium]
MSAQTTGKKILLAEDDRSLARMYTAKLEKSGYTVDLVSGGRDCLEHVLTFNPDVILLDIIIPQLDGFCVLQHLKEDPRTKDIVVILLTNLGQDEDIEKGKTLGAHDYLVKSQFTPAEIVERMEAALTTH